MDKIELIYMAVVFDFFFFFLLSSEFFVNCSPKLSQINVLKSVTTSLRVKFNFRKTLKNKEIRLNGSWF